MSQDFQNHYDRILGEKTTSQPRPESEMITIDHEPPSGPANESRRTFGKRNRQASAASVSQDFFKTPPASQEREPLRRPLHPVHNPEAGRDASGDKAFLGFLMTSGLPIRTIIAVAVIAVAAPAAVIAITENLPAPGIDPVTTASIDPAGGMAVSEVSMTKVMKTGSSVVSVFGRLENNSDQTKPLKPLWVTLYDNDGRVVQSWRHSIGRAKIPGGQNYRFMTSAIDYSGRAQTVRVTTTPQK